MARMTKEPELPLSTRVMAGTIALLVGAMWVFLMMQLAIPALAFAYDHRESWWGGMPLWAALATVLLGIAIGVPAIIITWAEQDD